MKNMACVLRTAYMYVKDVHTAEDIFQEVFIKVDKNLTNFRGNSSIKTWIIRITINACKDYLKSAYKRRVIPMEEYQEDAIVSQSDYDEVENQDTSDLIKKSILSLPTKYRDIVLCVYFQEMTILEAANTLKIPEEPLKADFQELGKTKRYVGREISDEF